MSRACQVGPPLDARCARRPRVTDRGRLVHSGHGQARSPCRPRCRVGRHPDPDQGCLASPGTDEPSRPDRRRSGCLARRHATDGRDQRRLCGADARDRPGRAQRTWIGCGRHAVRARRRAPTRRPARPEADAAGHRPGRHQRDVPAAEPGGRQRRRTDHPPRPAAAPRRPSSATSRHARRRRRARSSAIGCVISGGRRRPRSSRPRRRSSRSASSTTTRSARSRPSSRRTSTGWRGPSTTIRTWSARRASSRPISIAGGSSGAPARRPSEAAAPPEWMPETHDRPPIPEGDLDADVRIPER